MKRFFITLKEFDTLIDRMTLALDSANNLGQFTTSVKILFQMIMIYPQLTLLLLLMPIIYQQTHQISILTLLTLVRMIVI